MQIDQDLDRKAILRNLSMMFASMMLAGRTAPEDCTALHDTLTRLQAEDHECAPRSEPKPKTEAGYAFAR